MKIHWIIIILTILCFSVGCSGGSSSIDNGPEPGAGEEDVPDGETDGEAGPGTVEEEDEEEVADKYKDALELSEINGKSGIALQSTFKHTFPKAIDYSSVTLDSYFIAPTYDSASSKGEAPINSICDKDNAITTEIECWANRHCIIKPLSDLKVNTEYTVCLLPEITYADQTPFSGVSFSFTTVDSKVVDKDDKDGDDVSDDEDEGGGGDDGEDAAEEYGSCADEKLFDSLPSNLTDLNHIVPLGQPGPRGGHVLPTDHIYMISNKDVHGVHQQIDIRAPGNIFINSIIRAIYADGATDYTVEFALCDEVRGAIGHIDVLDGSLLSQAPFTEDNCSEWDTGDGKDEYCASYVNIELSGGDPIGTGDGWDFFLYDSRSTNNIINQAYAAVDSPNGKDHAVCPIDYFVEDLKVQMEPKFGVDHHDVFLPRTHLPVCGTLDQDLIGTAQGRWFSPGKPVNPEIYNLGLVFDHGKPELYSVFSIGKSIPGIEDELYYFTPASSGVVNKKFSEITDDGHVYCYEVGLDRGAPASAVLILQLTSDTTLRIEKKSETECPEGVHYFTEGQYADFVR